MVCKHYNNLTRLTGLTLYAKLFTSIYQGTLRGNSHGLLVFTNLLAHADSCGLVDVHPRAIAEEVGLTQDEVRAALLVLEAPDAESRSPEEEGRRIVRMDEHRAWGWRIVNYLKYRAIRNEEDRKEQNRIAQRRWREKNKPRNENKPRKPESAQAEAEAEEEEKREKPQRRASRLPADWTPSEALVGWARNERPDLDPTKTSERFRDFWTAKPGKDGTKLDWDATFRNWVRAEKSQPAQRRPVGTDDVFAGAK